MIRDGRKKCTMMLLKFVGRCKFKWLLYVVYACFMCTYESGNLGNVAVQSSFFFKDCVIKSVEHERARKRHKKEKTVDSIYSWRPSSSIVLHHDWLSKVTSSKIFRRRCSLSLFSKARVAFAACSTCYVFLFGSTVIDRLLAFSSISRSIQTHSRESEKRKKKTNRPKKRVKGSYIY
jgi:hypothetical protein